MARLQLALLSAVLIATAPVIAAAESADPFQAAPGPAPEAGKPAPRQHAPAAAPARAPERVVIQRVIQRVYVPTPQPEPKPQPAPAALPLPTALSSGHAAPAAPPRSDAVPDAWTHRQGRHHYCSPYVHQFCPGADDAAKAQCLRQHAAELSQDCSNALIRLGVLQGQ